MPTICVYCASSSNIPDRYLDLATAVGAGSAARGWQWGAGGGSVSMMGAGARAVRAAGGHTTGVIPRALVQMEVADHDADELIITDDMRARKGLMDDRADAFLALPGGIGTLEELMEVWTARCLGMHDKPVVGLDPWGDFALLREQVRHWEQQGFVGAAAVAELRWTTEVEQALDLIAAELATAVHQPGSRGGM